jgi:hypothetical protein
MWPRTRHNPADLLQDVRRRLRDVLDEVLRARTDADAIGRRWYECHLGDPLSPIYVLVDAPGNAIHVQTTGTPPSERVTVTYFPAWLLSALLDAEGFGALRLIPTDFAEALPVQVHLRCVRDLAECGPSPFEIAPDAPAVLV